MLSRKNDLRDAGGDVYCLLKVVFLYVHLPLALLKLDARQPSYPAFLGESAATQGDSKTKAPLIQGCLLKTAYGKLKKIRTIY